MNYQEFKRKWIGKAIDWDSHWGAQCFDVYRQYCKELGFAQSPPSEGAKDIWGNFLPECFIKIANTPDGVPQEGDVVIWGIIIGPYGHVSIFDHGDNKSFVSIDQNWPVDGGKGVLHEVTHIYRGVLGWLRPIIKEVSEISDEQKRILAFLGDATEGKVREAMGALADKQRLEVENESLRKLSDGLATSNTELSQKLDTSEKLVASWQSKYESANKSLDKLQSEMTAVAKERNQFKNWYEAKCEELKKLDKMTGLQHIKYGLKLLIKK